MSREPRCPNRWRCNTVGDDSGLAAGDFFPRGHVGVMEMASKE